MSLDHILENIRMSVFGLVVCWLVLNLIFWQNILVFLHTDFFTSTDALEEFMTWGWIKKWQGFKFIDPCNYAHKGGYRSTHGRVQTSCVPRTKTDVFFLSTGGQRWAGWNRSQRKQGRESKKHPPPKKKLIWVNQAAILQRARALCLITVKNDLSRNCENVCL